MIAIDLNKKTYAVATFDQIQAAMQQAMQRMQQQMQQNPQQAQQRSSCRTRRSRSLPRSTSRPALAAAVILNQPTNETKVQMDIAMQAIATGANAPPPGQPNSATATYSMNMDTFVAPGVAGYQEFAQFYRRMAQEVNWMKLPAMNVQIDPRVAQGMSELQQNSDALKGFPLLSYVSMTIAPLVPTDSRCRQTSQNSAPESATANPSATSVPRIAVFPPTPQPP